MIGVERDDLPRTYCIQLVYASNATPQKNGLEERVSRPRKISLKQLLLDMSLRPSKALPIQVAIARDHVLHTAAGIPPAIAMAGRCYFLAGRASAARNNAPESIDPAVRQLNSMRNLLNARNAINTADELGALVAGANRNYMIAVASSLLLGR